MIYELLGQGRENAKTARELAKVLAVDPRTVQRIVESERRHGAPICASTFQPCGYYRPASGDELQRYILSLASRERELRSTRRCLIATLNKAVKHDDRQPI